MKKLSVILGSIVFTISIAIIACDNSYQAPDSNMEGISELPQPLSKDSLVKRGKYLVSIMGCNDCHSPTVMTPNGPGHDPSRMLSGHPQNLDLPSIDKQMNGWVMLSLTGTAMVGPWGTSYSANITSDETGIGNWTEAQFFKAIREGKYKGLDNTRSLLPPMPWQAYAQASDEDLRAIFSYLKSTPPVNNLVPPPVLPYETNIE
jgi:hypothetical protein